MAFVQEITFFTNNNHFGTIEEFNTLISGLPSLKLADTIRQTYVSNTSLFLQQVVLESSNVIKVRREWTSETEFQKYRAEMLSGPETSVDETFATLGWTKTSVNTII